ncbi:hypothetical protein R1flu_026981 [Riccia fluitans]|uniref:Uncharacterized protein n=1 Tax=Riccia fluitans TaxID=41844 RepID=A0ABD1XHG9_9MARC
MANRRAVLPNQTATHQLTEHVVEADDETLHARVKRAQRSKTTRWAQTSQRREEINTHICLFVHFEKEILN